MATKQPFGDWLKARVGQNWVVAPRLTARLREKGHTVALPLKKYQELERQWETEFYGAPLKSLQAAAPDLLAAADEALSLLRAQGFGHTLVAAALDAAITKAKKGEPGHA